MHRLLPFVLSLLLCPLIQGCATTVDPSDLRAPKDSRTITLKDGYTYTAEVGGLCKATMQYSLLPGQYIAELEDGSGTFFRGAENSVISKVLATDCGMLGKGLQIAGGIFVPRSPKGRPKIYYHQPDNDLYDYWLSKAYGSSNTGLDSATVNNIATQTAPNAPVAATAVGAATGNFVINALIETGYGKINFAPEQPNDESLRSAITF